MEVNDDETCTKTPSMGAISRHCVFISVPCTSILHHYAYDVAKLVSTTCINRNCIIRKNELDEGIPQDEGHREERNSFDPWKRRKE